MLIIFPRIKFLLPGLKFTSEIMKNFIHYFALLFLPYTLFATNCIPDCECDTDWTLEVRGAYYQPVSKDLRKVYTNHWLDYQVEAAKRMDYFWELWGGVSWASKQGHTHRSYGYDGYAFKDSTKIFVLPVSVGFKLIYPVMPFIDLYAGAGICYSFLKIKNFCKEHYSYHGLSHSPFKKGIYKNDFGAIFKVGFQWALSDSTFLDFFADYFVQYFHLSHKFDRRDVFDRDIDCSGLKVGLGFGVYF